ncbi:hypothetical protein LS66_003125 [Helicobacter sp. MIT 03-1614]|uniref:hypothetical protein n=1 Tax=Helicobacter sp. MIT 03-1614 TaxID=1548147 RepID=UPI000513FC36|nr:hypothetical protein [Helicobacter sp. MIT 03-1614]TLD90475.1 hypothetical protein LS66_003125 [Helicobacter sp. MIT 03-1614]
MTDGFGFLIIASLFDIFICWLAAHIVLFIIFTIAYKKYHLFANKRFVIGIVCSGIVGSILGSLMGCILGKGTIEFVKIFTPIIFGIINVLSFFLVWCYMCLLTYRAYKKQENKKIYKTRHFLPLFAYLITLFLNSFYLSYKLS